MLLIITTKRVYSTMTIVEYTPPPKKEQLLRPLYREASKDPDLNSKDP